MGKELKIKLLELDLRQVDLCRMYREETGNPMDAPKMSSIINGRYVGPKADEVLEFIRKKIEEAERDKIA